MHHATRYQNLLYLGFIIVLPFVLFWRWVIQGQVLFWGTVMLQFWPWHHLVKTSLLNGRWPLWNPLLDNGTPLLANLQSAVFYPPNLLYLLLPVEHALTLSVVLHLIMAGVLMYFYARNLGLEPFAATVAALAYALSGYLVGRTQFVPMVNAAAWIPLLLLLSDKIATRPSGLTLLWLALVLAVQLLAGHAQLWFYTLWLIGAYILFRSWQANGPPRFRRLLQAGGRLLLAVGGAILLAAVQILPTAEFVLQSQRGDGAERTFALTYSFWPWRLVTLLLPNFFGHPAQGNYWGYANFWEDHAYLGILPFILALTAIWHYFKYTFAGRAGWLQNFRESVRVNNILNRDKLPGSSNLGQNHPINRANRLSANFREVQPNGSPRLLQVVPFFGALLPVSLILAMGWNTPVYLWVFNYIPGFNFFQAPARLLIWYTVAMAVLAGVGAQLFRSTAQNRPNWRRLLAACVALTAAGFLGNFFLASREVTFLSAVKITGVLLILSITLLLVRPQKETSRPLKVAGWQGLVLIFVAVDLLLAALPLVPTLPASIYTQPIASAQPLKNGPEQERFFVSNTFAYSTVFDTYFRFRAFGPAQTDFWQGLKESLVPNFGVYTGLPAANNDDPLLVEHRQQLTRRLATANAHRRARLLGLMNVGYFIGDQAGQDWPQIYRSNALTIWRVPNPLPRAYFVPQARYVSSPADVLSTLTAANFDSRREVVIMNKDVNPPQHGNNVDSSAVGSVAVAAQTAQHVQLSVDTPGVGFVVLTDTYYPGWQATVDGQPAKIWQANLAFRAVAVEAGQHTVDFYYRPYSFTIGLWASAITGLAIAVAIIWTTTHPKKQMGVFHLSRRGREVGGSYPPSPPGLRRFSTRLKHTQNKSTHPDDYFNYFVRHRRLAGGGRH